MRYWKGIVYSLSAVLAVWRLSKMSMRSFMCNSGQWHGGVHKKKVALLFSQGLHGWVYRIREFTVTHATLVNSVGYYIGEMMPKHILDAFKYNGILFSVSDVTTLSKKEIDEMVESYGDGTDFLAPLIPTEKKYVMELCKAFDDLPTHIDIPIKFTLFRRR